MNKTFLRVFASGGRVISSRAVAKHKSAASWVGFLFGQLLSSLSKRVEKVLDKPPVLGCLFPSCAKSLLEMGWMLLGIANSCSRFSASGAKTVIVFWFANDF